VIDQIEMPPDSAERAAAQAAVERLATTRVASLTGSADVGVPDPTEDYHEASRFYRGCIDPRVTGGQRLGTNLELRVSATRSVKRHAHLPAVPLPAAELGGATLAEALTARRSRRAFGKGSLACGQLASLLHAAYGVTASLDGTPQLLRTVLSGGALYPLELYVAAQRVEGLDQALYHYDPLRHVLERLAPLPALDSACITPYAELVEVSAAVVAITAMFWRSRFKYGARAYRFTLLEAGHVAQNLLLAAASLGLAALPLGGFYDRELDALLEIDGLYEASLYLLPVGPEPA
jgi:SagB-type dehydrogenase family enzyme